ncbi:GNAT family N-acetyltransferase [uncultured Litoreibacter sp.]|uniref:GNAT family N-acetyltransferase n=1 Tax=uncultured Litoreibacter sp. TaxID=1392394 RepID=UPI002616E77B|nr:GNAT family N-acetyltransferase [uncultured Litoreibacter sp.]
MSLVSFSSPTLETERLILRAPKAEDFPALRAFFASERAAFVGGPVEDERTAWRILADATGMWVLRGFGSFIITRKGSDAALGLTGPWYPASWPEKELGWTCWDENIEGTGIMFEAASAARDFAFRTLGWDTAVSYIDGKNTRSIRLAERLGAAHDPRATGPHEDDLVYRHPKPEAAI